MPIALLGWFIIDVTWSDMDSHMHPSGWIRIYIYLYLSYLIYTHWELASDPCVNWDSLPPSIISLLMMILLSCVEESTSGKRVETGLLSSLQTAHDPRCLCWWSRRWPYIHSDGTYPPTVLCITSLFFFRTHPSIRPVSSHAQGMSKNSCHTTNPMMDENLDWSSPLLDVPRLAFFEGFLSLI